VPRERAAIPRPEHHPDGFLRFGPVAPHFRQTPLATRGLCQFYITDHIGRYRVRREQSRELYDPPTYHSDRAAHVGM
jgi:hypothetical protein